MFIYIIKPYPSGKEWGKMPDGGIHITREPDYVSSFYASMILEVSDDGEVKVLKNGKLPVFNETSIPDGVGD